jgi:hypothetical protein
MKKNKGHLEKEGLMKALGCQSCFADATVLIDSDLALWSCSDVFCQDFVAELAEQSI